MLRVVCSGLFFLGRRGCIVIYEGEELNACGIINTDFSQVEAVAVSGDGPNVCGHLLLYNPKGGIYFHVAGLRAFPRYMTDGGFKRYLSETGKTELRRRRLDLPNPSGAYIYMESLLAEKWTWGVLPNNCVAFVEEIIKAGGGNWYSMSNCPAVAITDDLSERMGRFYQQMENDIYSLYGVAR
jgi:hypothetical protein